MLHIFLRLLQYVNLKLYTQTSWGFLLFLHNQNVTSSPQYSTFLEHIIPRFLTFLQDGEVQFLQEKPAQVIFSKLSGREKNVM